MKAKLCNFLSKRVNVSSEAKVNKSKKAKVNKSKKAKKSNNVDDSNIVRTQSKGKK
jgi:hypothetical protein